MFCYYADLNLLNQVARVFYRLAFSHSLENVVAHLLTLKILVRQRALFFDKRPFWSTANIVCLWQVYLIYWERSEESMG